LAERDGESKVAGLIGDDLVVAAAISQAYGFNQTTLRIVLGRSD
jgi:hypothetical protein